MLWLSPGHYFEPHAADHDRVSAIGVCVESCEKVNSYRLNLSAIQVQSELHTQTVCASIFHPGADGPFPLSLPLFFIAGRTLSTKI